MIEQKRVERRASIVAFSLNHRAEQAEAASKRPDLKMLRPDFTLKASQPAATPAGIN